MKYGIFSDVHGNIEALDVVLKHLAEQGVDIYAFLGDAVGYGANPNEVCDRIREVVSFAVLGNHDAAVSGRMDYSDYYDAARESLNWCQERLSSANMEWLKGLPYKQQDGRLEFCHGAPLAPELFDYLFAPEQVVDLLEADIQLADFTFIGHSHLTISFELTATTVTPMIVPEIQCKDEAKYVITAGSVGQPRDRDPRTCCGVFDTEAKTFTFHRLEYEIGTTRQKILDAGLSPVFAERLLVGM